jgi:hypothetical protein
MNGIDLASAVEAKIAKNATRTYRRLRNGVLIKTSEPLSPEQWPQH